MINTSDYNLIAFKAITTFTNELDETFGKQNHPLRLYNRLLAKTTISHDKAIKKHIELFRDFCVMNRDALLGKDARKFVNSKVEYSPSKVFIDFNNIFNKSDSETVNVIWKHLLTISALLDPAGNAKEILKNSKDSSEADFLTDIINKVETHVRPDANPMEAVSSIMSSGVFTELISGMNNGIQDGSLDLGKLMGTVQKMCTSLGGLQGTPGAKRRGDTDGAPNDGMNILNNLMSNMNTGGGDGAAPDLTQLTSLLGPMLSGLQQPKVDEVDS